MKARVWILWLALCSAGCAGRAPTLTAAGPLNLQSSNGAPKDVSRLVSGSRLTVFVFYSETCPCLRVHEDRLKRIQADYAPRGVSLVLVNSEVGAEPSRDAREARRRAYPFPLLTDPQARLARALNAQFATHAVVVDAEGRIRYSGGIDSDKNHLRETASPYLRDAIDELLAGRPARVVEHEALGCALQLR